MISRNLLVGGIVQAFCILHVSGCNLVDIFYGRGMADPLLIYTHLFTEIITLTEVKALLGDLIILVVWTAPSADPVATIG